MGQELEWKYDVPDQSIQDEILRWEPIAALSCGPMREYRMRTFYYDTPDRFLGKRLCTLRRRMENDRSVVCVKAPLPGGNNPMLRGEWELEAQDLAPALPELVRSGAPREILEASPLICTAGAEFTRRAVDLRFEDGSRSELSLDLGSLLGASERMPLCELELELKEGKPDASLAFLRKLCLRFSLTPQPLSKYARARSLA